MKKLLLKIYKTMTLAGFDPLKFINLIRGLPLYVADLENFKRQQKAAKNSFGKICFTPSLGDRFSKSGSASGHYFHQDLLVARRIYENSPVKHVDVGSRVDGFVAHVASFRPIEVFDVRPQDSTITNISFIECDLTRPLKAKNGNCTDSLSCLHALEHFGLGRYGDPVFYDGYLAGWENLYKILKKGGELYFSVPIGPQRIEFNSHRVFSVSYLLDLCRGKYDIDSFSFVDDKGDLYENVKLDEGAIKSNFGCWYGCGIFEMTKL